MMIELAAGAAFAIAPGLAGRELGAAAFSCRAARISSLTISAVVGGGSVDWADWSGVTIGSGNCAGSG